MFNYGYVTFALKDDSRPKKSTFRVLAPNVFFITSFGRLSYLNLFFAPPPKCVLWQSQDGAGAVVMGNALSTLTLQQ
jgi:hypothetical protein